MERLDKLLVRECLGSRKAVQKLIKDGKVAVNGVVIRRPEEKIAEETASMTVEGVEIPLRKTVTYLLHKPQGVLSATEDAECPTVLDLLPPQLRRKGLAPAGRLDKDTTGLLLLTDDGAFAHRILSPKHHVEKEYVVTVDKPLPEKHMEQIRRGLVLSDFTCKPAAIWQAEGGLHCYHIVLTEGKFHQVKRMLHAGGCEVLTLKRIRIGGLTLPEDLPEGAYRLATEKELEQVLNE